MIFLSGRILNKKRETKKAIAIFQEAAKLDPESKAIAQELSLLKQKLVHESAEQKKLYKKMLGSPKEKSQTSNKNSSSSSTKSKSKFGVWSILGGTLAAVAGVIVYRLAF